MNVKPKVKRMKRDAIDFGKTNIPRLFVRLFIPTFIGLLFGAMLNLADGIFVGRGAGSDALAAVNICAPAFLLLGGVALMFGAGVSVVAAIHLSRHNVKAANINITQAFTVSLTVASVIVLVIVAFPGVFNRLFGGSALLEPYVTAYLRCVAVGLLGSVVMFVALFVIRLDGSPQYAMITNVVPAVVNIFLDWLFVFPLRMGISGAAVATSISEVIGVVMVVIYFRWFRKTVSLYRPKFSAKAIRLTLRNIAYMMKVGFPTFLGETALACMMIVGNFKFMSLLCEDGVAAFSVACYLFPLVFMFGNAIAQSSLPIVSYNHGLGNTARISRTFRLSVVSALACGTLITLAVILFSDQILRLFLGNQQAPLLIGQRGLPLFATAFVLFTVNIVLIGYLQSLEKSRPATFFMLLRGYVMVIPCFLLMPGWIGERGLWLAVPTSEALTLLVILAYFGRGLRRK